MIPLRTCRRNQVNYLGPLKGGEVTMNDTKRGWRRAKLYGLRALQLRSSQSSALRQPTYIAYLVTGVFVDPDAAK
jgi:hypothetical protein